MDKKRKFSISAIIIIILLALRLITQIYIFLFSMNAEINLISLLFLGVIGLLALFYGITLAGVIKKSKWGINLVMAIAILDIIFGGVLDLIMGTAGNISSIGAIIIDIILIVLAGNIAKRIKK